MSRLTRLALLALTLLAAACGADPVDKLQDMRLTVDPGRTLRQVLEGYRCFSNVLWSRYEDAQGRPVGSVTAVFNPDCLIGARSRDRVFTARDRAVLARAGANLCLKLEYVFPSGEPAGRFALLEARLVTFEWTRAAPLDPEAVLREIASGRTGEALARTAIDAADYCRSRLFPDGADRGNTGAAMSSAVPRTPSGPGETASGG